MQLMMILNVVYVLLAIAMIALILMQRGAGAQAGSGFGAGASATVFGSRGAGNFLSKSTKYLAIVFFGISMFMAWHATNSSTAPTPAKQDLGVMSEMPAAPASSTTVPGTPAAQAPAGAVPIAPANPPSAGSAPTAVQPQPQQPQPAQPEATPPQGG